MTCRPVDLIMQYRHKYAVTGTEVSGPGPLGRDPGPPMIQTRTGEVHPHSATHLAVVVCGHPEVARGVAELGYPVLEDWGDAKAFLVPGEDLDRVAPLIRPHRRKGPQSP